MSGYAIANPTYEGFLHSLRAWDPGYMKGVAKRENSARLSEG